MVSQKKDKKPDLTPVKKGTAKVIRLNGSGEEQDQAEQEPERKEKDERVPPLNNFNSGYFKGRDNDPL